MRSQRCLSLAGSNFERVAKLLPTAKRLNVLICLEEVWNNFLLSPREFAAYVDGFRTALIVGTAVCVVGAIAGWRLLASPAAAPVGAAVPETA